VSRLSKLIERAVRRRRGTWLRAPILVGLVAAGMAVATPARANQTVADVACLANTTASMSLEKPTVPARKQTTLRTALKLSEQCSGQTFTLLGYGPTAVPMFLPNMVVTPSNSGARPGNEAGLGTYTWSLRMSTLTGGLEILATVVVTVVPQAAPPVPLPNGQTSVSITDNSAASRSRLLSGLVTPNATVSIAGNVNMDLSGAEEIHIARGCS
jgi:hypothetical protein